MTELLGVEAKRCGKADCHLLPFPAWLSGVLGNQGVLPPLSGQGDSTCVALLVFCASEQAHLPDTQEDSDLINWVVLPGIHVECLLNSKTEN